MYIPRWTIVLVYLATITSHDLGVLGTPYCEFLELSLTAILLHNEIGHPSLKTRTPVPFPQPQGAHTTELTVVFDKTTSTPNEESYGILAGAEGLLWKARNSGTLKGNIPSDLLRPDGRYLKAGTKTTRFTVRGGPTCGNTGCRGVIECEGTSVITKGSKVLVSVDAEGMQQMIQDGIDAHKADLNYHH
ncbi:hypothetical protein EV361DRAFT_865003 [Lentinula raphanica]|nr:hypothetical protein F5880DRAFT_1503695 [Lentinula raphanica]KAJ3975930.1 hypothetical protein EV361DRAFT_865003 [Lentinula raphanica]